MCFKCDLGHREDCDDEAPSSPVTLALEEIKVSLGVIQDECDNYGGWAGEDAEAKIAMDLGHDLLALGFAVGLHGREFAESGSVAHRDSLAPKEDTNG